MNRESGGSLVGYSKEGDPISSSRYGEFICSINGEGKLLAIFKEKGVMCGYDDDTELAFVSIDAVAFLERLTDKDLSKMANGGKNIRALRENMKKNVGRILFVTIYPSLGVVYTEIRNEREVFATSEESGINWSEGYGGVLAYGDNGREIELAFYAMKRGDEMVVSIGEPSGDVKTLIPVSIGNKVDYILELESESPKRFVNLADKILLGR
ncbi:MAG: hypothetical protein ACD_61C00197G0002 [uncultured bacterium]|nr:MAG: hypothetical protein ACD_61C00197G0002 [uncultured bacterium]